MNLHSHLQLLVSDTAASAAGTGFRCTSGNFRWERAVTDGRAEEYNTYVGEVVTHKDWKAEHKGYVDEFVYVAKDFPRGAGCFLAINTQAQLNENLDNTCLLRLESVGRLFVDPLTEAVADNFWTRFFNSQKDLRKTKLTDDSEQLRAEFVDQWNEFRAQARPMFATFLNEFGGNLDNLIKADWPHLLRDRLGLTHWPSTPGTPVPVALMCYTVDEVREARAAARKKGAVSSFTRPTVLDSEMSSAFIPAPLLPGGESYGYTLDLANPGIPETFAPELLTFPIEYQPKHIKALGFISREHALQDDEAVLAARNRHVQGLQQHLPGCADFGEVLA